MRSFIFLLSLVLMLPATAGSKSILVLGDSLSASYGIPMEQGWVNLLRKRLASGNYNYQVHNASITGETTAGGKVRIRGLMQEYIPEIVIIELGGNDGLRGLQLQEIKTNLATIIRQIRQHDAEVLLIPMQMPTNYGPLFNERFTQMYRELAEEHDIMLGTFILENIGDNPELMQEDGIHPAATAQSMMLDNIWPGLRSLLGSDDAT